MRNVLGRMRRAAVWIAVCAMVMAGVFDARADESPDRALLLLSSTSYPEIKKLVDEQGGALIAYLPEASSAIVRIDDTGLTSLRTRANVLDGSRRALHEVMDRVHLDSDPAMIAVQAWNRMVEQPALELQQAEPPHMSGDVMIGPDWWDAPIPMTTHSTGGSSDPPRPFGAEWDNTSEFLAGDISLNVFLVESDGASDPSTENWTSTQESYVLARVLDGLSSLQQMYPNSDLAFTVHLIRGRNDWRAQTSYEPINRSADPYGSTGEDLWVKEILGKMGYPFSTRLIRSRQLADATRSADNTDWAVNVFVVNSEQDADGRFVDGRFAYAWLGGPHIIMTTDNNGWGISRFDRVFRHELMHSFYALDKYVGSGCSCNTAAGYLSGLNDNCLEGCSTQEPCVMIDNSTDHCEATDLQVGTHDTDGDGTPDVLDVSPEMTMLLESNEPVCYGPALFTGDAAVVPYPNQNPFNVTTLKDISLHELTDIEVSINDGPWQGGVVSPLDGAFDSATENFSVNFALQPGLHSIKMRAVDSRGNVSLIASRSVDMAEPAQAVDDSLRVSLDLGVALSWDAAPGAVGYRIRRAQSPKDVASAGVLVDVGSTSWTDVDPGNFSYLITAIDACGQEIP